jgi:predicted transcriptional regulator
MAKRKSESLTDQLKRIIDESGLSIYRIAKDADVPQSGLQMFVSGQRDLRLGTVDKLAVYFGIRFTKPKGHPPTV